jgi:hypothetical protein
MSFLGVFLGIAGSMLLIFGIIWLHTRGFKDAAFADPLLFLTGVSLFSYMSARWDRAKVPVFLALAGLICLFCSHVIRINISKEKALHPVVERTDNDFEQPNKEASDKDTEHQLSVNTTEEQFSDEHVVKIILKQDEKILLDGVELSLLQLDEELGKRKSEIKCIWYHREGHENDSGPDNLEKVFDIITKYRLPIAIYWDSEFKNRVLFPEE